MSAPPANGESDTSSQLAGIVETGNAEHLAAFLQLLPPEDTAYTISHVDEEVRTRMLGMLTSVNPELAADLMEHFADEHAAEMIEDLEPHVAAAIVDEMDSDEQTDVLAEMADADARAILDRMDPVEADDARRRLAYDEDTAGGLMITEFLSYDQEMDCDGVIADLRAGAEEYGDHEIRYLYITSGGRLLRGVVTMRTLVMARRGERLRDLMIDDPARVPADAPLEQLEDLFDRVSYSAVPVVDGDGALLGVVQRAAVQEALSESANEDLLKVSGIVGGEELRSMPLLSRAVHRMAFLLPIMLLLLASASIIALFEPTVKRLPILAAFLPVVAGLCGSGGNQAVGVSMREISLGLIKPSDFFRVLLNEAGVAIINGLVLGVALGSLVWWWRGDARLALAVGGAVPIVIVVAKCVGGGVPLLLRGIGMDPAMASGPIVTTVVDLVSFLIVLVFATLLIAGLASE